MNEQTIKLDQFLKWIGIAETGGHAKILIQSGEVRVNDTLETRRSRRLHPGDTVETLGEQHTVTLPPPPPQGTPRP
ncbi:MAG: RNA-binding S4 domain-containing protein [Planctomycetota bacterium]